MMKTFKLLSALMMAFAFSLSALAQSNKGALVIVCTDGEKISVPADELERLTFDYTEQSSLVAVDMGVSVKWANVNLDISKSSKVVDVPEEYGGYYGWADSTGLLTEADVNLYPAAERPLNIGGSKYDIATRQLGNGWRLPSKAEFEELFANCSWQRTTLNGVKGIKVSAKNGNWLFFPYAGYRYKLPCFQQGEYGYYWTGDRHEKNGSYAADLNIGADICRVANQIIYNGCSVRAVKEIEKE